MNKSATSTEKCSILVFTDSFFLYRVGQVDVRMGEAKASETKISTAGLTGCYAFLITGEYQRSPFCWLEHQPFSMGPNTSAPPTLLHQIAKRFAKDMKPCLQEIFRSSINLADVTNLALLVAGGLQEFPDDVRNALALLQQPFHQKLLGSFSTDPEVSHLVQHLQSRTIITAPLGYCLSDETEDRAAAAGNS